MTHGTAPHFPSPAPPDLNPTAEDNTTIIEPRTSTEYNEDELWMDPPDYTPPGPLDTEKHSRRTANHSAYRINGHPTIWRNYIYFGFYTYNDCNDFFKAWKATVHDRLERQRFIWREYHYRRLNNIHISDMLLQRVNEKTIPYIKEHDPDLWLASDMEYEEVMFFHESSQSTASKLLEKEAWHEVSPKRRAKKSTPPSSRTNSPNSNSRKSPPTTMNDAATPMTKSTTPPPSMTDDGRKDVVDIDSDNTPPRRTSHPNNPYPKRTIIQNSESMEVDQPNDYQPPSLPDKPRNQQPRLSTTDPKLMHNNLDLNPNRTGTDFISVNSTVGNGSHQKSIHTHTTPTNPINDGTFRLTVRWKPANYDNIYANQDRWDDNLIETITDVFGEYAETINLIKWDDTTQTHKSSIEQVQESGGIRKFMSPRITHLESSAQFIFGLRISMGDSTPSRWINDQRTKRTMQDNSIAINISNSKTNSGEVVTAGHILLKHPEYTHRTYYLMSLRRSVPETTPFFDIGLVYTTPHGEKIPHLIVKCGSNHVTALTETLSAHLDGKKTTALFLATTMLKTMTTEEAHGLFSTHKQFLTSIQRLPLFPQVINIDRVRTEYNSNSITTERSTREWATGLRSKETGELLRCDAENGGKDKRAYLLVPTAYLDQAKLEFEQYKHRLTQSSQSRNHQSHSDNRCANEDRPQEIYVPTAAVLRNLQFMQNMSSESIWKAAPPTVRPRSMPQPTFHHQRETSLHHTASKEQLTQYDRRLLGQRPSDHNKSSTLNQPAPKKSLPNDNVRPSISDEATTVCTTQSPLTRNTQTQSTISALEETIQRQQQEIRNMLNRFDAMDKQMEHLTTAIKSGESNQNHTILQIQQQLDQVCSSLTFLVQQTTNHQSRNQLQHRPPNEVTPTHATDTQAEHDDITMADNNTRGDNLAATIEDLAIIRPRSPIGKSPEKKKQRSSQTNERQSSEDRNNSAHNSTRRILVDEDDEKSKNDTDQSGAQYNFPSPSDGGNPD